MKKRNLEYNVAIKPDKCILCQNSLSDWSEDSCSNYFCPHCGCHYILSLVHKYPLLYVKQEKSGINMHDLADRLNCNENLNAEEDKHLLSNAGDNLENKMDFQFKSKIYLEESFSDKIGGEGRESRNLLKRILEYDNYSHIGAGLYAALSNLPLIFPYYSSNSWIWYFSLKMLFDMLALMFLDAFDEAGNYSVWKYGFLLSVFSCISCYFIGILGV